MEERTVLKLDFTVDPSDVLPGAYHILKLVRSTWKQEEIKHKIFDNGITNKLFGFHQNDQKEDTVLIRVNGNGTEKFLDRKAEVESFQLLHEFKCAPNLYCIFNNGLCYEFIHGSTLTPETIRAPKIYRQLTKELAKMHCIPFEGETPPEASVFKRMRMFVDLAFPSHLPQSNGNGVIMSERQKFEDEIEDMERHLVSLNSPVVFCHNDLLVHNIIYNDKKGKITFIDYEYASFNYQAFDIGNHYCEFAGVETVDYSLYPNKSLQREWLRSYLQAMHEMKNPNAPELEESEITAQVHTLYRQVNKFALAGHLLWGIWGLVQAKYSQIDFDFKEYSKLRMDEYYKRKEEFLAL